MMRKNIGVCAVIMAIMCAFASCSSSDTTSTVSYSDDAAITAFTLGTIKDSTWVDKKASPKGAKDSLVVKSISGSTYTVSIDQVKRLIYNADSLPMHTKMLMLATVSTKNSGYLDYQSYADGVEGSTWTDYYSTDSIDFSSPLRFRVISTDVSSAQYYKVDIRRHKSDPDLFVWHDLYTSGVNFAGSSILKGISVSNGLFVLCDAGVYVSYNYGQTWSPYNTAAKGQSIVAKGTDIYVVDSINQKTYVNDNTTALTPNTPLRTLIAATNNRVYAVSKNYHFLESTDGVNWTVDAIDKYHEDSTFIPVKDVCYTLRKVNSNPYIQTIVVVGNKQSWETAAWDTCAVTWTKVVALDDESSTVDSWTQAEGSYDEYLLPHLENLSSCGYNTTWTLAIGGRPMPASVKSTTAYDRVFVSYHGDNGVVWTKKDGLELPTGTAYDPDIPVLIMSDDSGYVYVINSTDGSVWRGGMNSVIWKKMNSTQE